MNQNKVKLPKITLSNMGLFDEDAEGNVTFSKGGKNYRVQYQPQHDRLGWIPYNQTGGGMAKRPQKNKDKLMYWLLLKGMNEQQNSSTPYENQTGGAPPTEKEMSNICQQVTQTVNIFNESQFKTMVELEDAFQDLVKRIFNIPQVQSCDILEKVKNDLNEIMEKKEAKILLQRRQREQQKSEKDIFNETRRFGYYYGVYQGKEYSKLTFYHSYHCVTQKLNVTFFGHINKEDEVLKFMDTQFTTNMCDRLKVNETKEQTMDRLLKYLSNFVSKERIRGAGSIVFYVNDYVFLTAINQNMIETKVMGETAPVSIGLEKSLGKIKMRAFSKKEIPDHKTYNIIVGSKGFWHHNRPGLIESAWGLITGESNFEEMIGTRDQEERRRICQKLVQQAAKRNPREDISVIFTEICGESINLND
jgi:hypothetical protein